MAIDKYYDGICKSYYYMLHFTNYIVSFFVLIIVDYLGLAITGLRSGFTSMASQIGFVVDINYYGAFATYLLMLIGFFSFVDLDGSPYQAFLYGLVTHGIYELTNYSTIQGWQSEFMMLDIIWGGTLYTILFYILNAIRKIE